MSLHSRESRFVAGNVLEVASLVLLVMASTGQAPGNHPVVDVAYLVYETSQGIFDKLQPFEHCYARMEAVTIQMRATWRCAREGRWSAALVHADSALEADIFEGESQVLKERVDTLMGQLRLVKVQLDQLAAADSHKITEFFKV